MTKEKNAYREIMSTEADPRLTDAAARLFARLGYDGTTTEMLVNAAGVSRETVEEAGGRTGLYRRTLERSRDEQLVILDEIARGLTKADDRLDIVMTAILDYFLDNIHRRDVLAIWRERWMMDAADLADIEENSLQPIRQKILSILGPDIAETREFRLISIAFALCLTGYVTGGAILPDGSHLNPDDPRDRMVFRSYMRELIEKLRRP
jgi:AcrR family transcriptional regulator